MGTIVVKDANNANQTAALVAATGSAVSANSLPVVIASDQVAIPIKPYGLATGDWQATSGVTALATTTSTLVHAAGAAGIRNYMTGLQAFNSSATATTLAILDGATVIWNGYLPASGVGPIEFDFPTPLKGTAATAMNIQCGTAAAAVYWNAQGYQGS